MLRGFSLSPGRCPRCSTQVHGVHSQMGTHYEKPRKFACRAEGPMLGGPSACLFKSFKINIRLRHGTCVEQRGRCPRLLHFAPSGLSLMPMGVALRHPRLLTGSPPGTAVVPVTLFGVSPATVKREWAAHQAWLHRELKEKGCGRRNRNAMSRIGIPAYSFSPSSRVVPSSNKVLIPPPGLKY